MAEALAVIDVEVAYAEADRQILRRVRVPSTATLEQAIRQSGILSELPADFVPAGLGIFGRCADVNSPLRDGDRIELYRPLAIDPKEARRRRAKKKLRRA